MFPFTIFCYLKENNIISVKAAKVLGYFNSLDGIPLLLPALCYSALPTTKGIP
jgi:hypothetical protein